MPDQRLEGETDQSQVGRQVGLVHVLGRQTQLGRHHDIRVFALRVGRLRQEGVLVAENKDAVIAMLRNLLALLSTSVFSHEGTIDKFLGDGLLAVFGAPMSSPGDATNAARCALDMLHTVDRWNEHDHRSGDAAIQVAVGIHYGDVVQGDIGSDKQLELTVLGDTVNIASRVEGYCRSLDAAVLVSKALVDALHSEGSDDLATRFADQGRHMLRGRAEPVHLYGLKRSARTSQTQAS